MLVISIFSFLPQCFPPYQRIKIEIFILATVNLSSANALSLVQLKRKCCLEQGQT